MGFIRTRQPDRPIPVITAAEIERVMREADPFGVTDRCPVNPSGHQTIVSCGEIVCWHCARIFWR